MSKANKSGKENDDHKSTHKPTRSSTNACKEQKVTQDKPSTSGSGSNFFHNLFSKKKRSKNETKPICLDKYVQKYNIPHKELKDLYDAFQLFDLDHDGFICDQELAVMLERLGQPASKHEVKLMIERASTSDKSKISFDDFVEMMAKHTEYLRCKSHLQDALELFNILDQNNDGYITCEELRNGMRLIRERFSEQEVTRMIDYADKDRDGKISLDEFFSILNEDELRNKVFKSSDDEPPTAEKADD